ncbi:argonaute/piwi family protein [Sphingosinicella terrae]|uniref:argonaute/piwi family protein n=1 Tax=Sphingosinicella terrae TaxID=2172047 RepID=UPI002549BAA9|nr:hypothetical protein [Sphingosinicella terrae]
MIGTASGIDYFRRWAAAASRAVRMPKRGPRDKANRLHLSDFPGLEEAFGLRLDPDTFTLREIDLQQVLGSINIENHHEAVSRTVDVFLRPIETHVAEEERSMDVWVLVVPEIVFETCRPKMAGRRKGELIPGKLAKKQGARSDLPLLSEIIDQSAESVFDDVPDFHRQVKARLLRLAQPSQLIRETTLAPHEFLNKAGKPSRGTQDPASVAWNLATGLFYKTQGTPPWRIAGMRPGVCYVGLVFKLIPNHPQHHACCAAQMFLSEGDGVVFRGANGPWRSEDKEFHLPRERAKALLSMVLETYKSRFQDYPRELFVHGRANFSDDEWAGFADAAPAGTSVVGIRIKSTHGETKVFREGDYPVLRGTALLLDPHNAYLWAAGYAPRIDTYLGPETPNPLFITTLRSTGELPDIRTVLSDVMGLTKINYNACNFSDAVPVTIRFADKVGDVLVMGSAAGTEKQPFKFYI